MMNECDSLAALRIWSLFFVRPLCVFFLFFCVDPSLLHGAEPGVQRVAVVVSLNIRPYLEAVEGIKTGLSEQREAVITVFNMEDYAGKAQNLLSEGLRDTKFDICIAVGPDAARLIWSGDSAGQALKIYTMVLHPDKVLDSREPVCGISLDIPAETMMQIFSKVLPSLTRIGLLYDPENNATFARQAALEAPVTGLQIIPLEVSSRKEIPDVLKAHWDLIDGLWLIPDQTIITESLVRFIIKQCIFHEVVAFGYNRFFYENGAALSTILDYREIGEKTAELSLASLRGGVCRKQAPKFKVLYNSKVLNRIGVDPMVDPSADVIIERGP